MLRSVNAGPTRFAAPGLWRADTPCINTFRKPRLNNWVVNVAVLTRLSRPCSSLLIASIFPAPWVIDSDHSVSQLTDSVTYLSQSAFLCAPPLASLSRPRPHAGDQRVGSSR